MIVTPFSFTSRNGRCQGKSQNSNLKIRRERTKNEVADGGYIGADVHGFVFARTPARIHWLVRHWIAFVGLRIGVDSGEHLRRYMWRFRTFNVLFFIQ